MQILCAHGEVDIVREVDNDLIDDFVLVSIDVVVVMMFAAFMFIYFRYLDFLSK